MDDEVMGIIERGRLSFHAGNALIAIFEGDFAKAEFHIGRERVSSAPLEGGTSNRAVALLPGPERKRGGEVASKRGRARKDAPGTFASTRAVPAAKSGVRVRTPEAIPSIEVGQGVPILKRGEKRVCGKCGEAKGCTGYSRGSLVCKTCEKGKSGGASTKPKRTCAVCKRELGHTRFKAGSDTCIRCSSTKTVRGGSLKNIDPASPRRIFENTRVADRSKTDPRVPNQNYRVCKGCDKPYYYKSFPDDGDLCRQCANPDSE